MWVYEYYKFITNRMIKVQWLFECSSDNVWVQCLEIHIHINRKQWAVLLTICESFTFVSLIKLEKFVGVAVKWKSKGKQQGSKVESAWEILWQFEGGRCQLEAVEKWGGKYQTVATIPRSSDGIRAIIPNKVIKTEIICLSQILFTECFTPGCETGLNSQYRLIRAYQTLIDAFYWSVQKNCEFQLRNCDLFSKWRSAVKL